MIKFHITIPSYILHRPVMVMGALPYGIMHSFSKTKVVWGLHCAMEDASLFFDKLMIGNFIDKYQVAFIAPSLGNGYFINSSYEKQSDFLNFELLPVLREMLPLSDKQEDNYLIGISMGAFGAARWSLAFPELFSKICLLSGIYFAHLKIDDRARKNRELKPLVHIFSDQIMPILMKDSQGNLTEAADIRPFFKTNSPLKTKYTIFHGNQDYISIEQSKLFVDSCKANDINVQLNVKEGGHNLTFWSSVIEECFQSLLKDEEET